MPVAIVVELVPRGKGITTSTLDWINPLSYAARQHLLAGFFMSGGISPGNQPQE
jgi:hypothetical protein